MSTSNFLHIGDRISLYHEPTNGFLGAEGFAVTQVGIDRSDGSITGGDKTRSEVRDAVFVVHQMSNCSAAKQIKAYLDRNGVSMAEAQGDARCRPLLEARAKEEKINAQEFEQSKGRDVRYGMIVQLQHDTSHKCVAVLRESAELNRDGRRVALEKDAGEGAWFRIMPRLRVHSEGEKVHVDDPVLLEGVESGLKLNVDANASLSVRRTSQPRTGRRGMSMRFALLTRACPCCHALSCCRTAARRSTPVSRRQRSSWICTGRLRCSARSRC